MVERPLQRVASVTTDVSTAYQGFADAWARGPAMLYDQLASVAIAEVARELRGATVLDVGAGTGALCRVLRHAGAIPVALDSSNDMLSLAGDAAEFALVGDMCALPFARGRFDAAVSGFAISHVDAPEEALREMGRVVRPGGRVIATVFGEDAARASKNAVDEVALEFGYVPPAWYIHLKTSTEPRTNTPALLRSCAESAGLDGIEVHDPTVDSGLDTPEAITAYRTGLAYLAPFVAALTDQRREEFIDRAIAAVRQRGQRVRPRVLVLSSRAPA
jgi:ubiquinone/menaquinone biosynthesis C-methylase UbiE